MGPGPSKGNAADSHALGGMQYAEHVLSKYLPRGCVKLRTLPAVSPKTDLPTAKVGGEVIC